ncbi:alkaline phosphatase-like protein [Piedraia hortae CBS 480.64]|uniref:Alkaline phosphatase-like protein n=1 Tax=Piedraia hortae CBS 480.64 TaxID=1314780 RepID=A0A6A7BVF3_9PEZI|nr:alkaline phosphatase-like protein [Piedraia hortae CBS 480.64]
MDDARKGAGKQHGLTAVFFTLVTVFHVFGIYLFCSGFLLSRLVLPDRSECGHAPTAVKSVGSVDDGCWHPKTFNRAVFVIIDALRYDFTVPTEDDAYFHNALPVLYETAVERPHNALLRPCIADPPTTTLQRLKGLTTGTLPTFIDAGSNFAGTAVDEDNWVEQLYRAGKRIVHLGDDTWHALFPGYFDMNLTKPYDSFNVWDLHTVDNGVNEHLFPLLEMGEGWDLIVAHYLGVDHAGHRYGPDHPAMRDKLMQMDRVLRRMVETIDEDTLLVVMGDHGMDIKGDHGGESDDEIEAALWMFSKRDVFSGGSPPPLTAKERFVGQIDIVPTLSLLLGLPIPFNNLGQPIEDAFLGPSMDYSNQATVSKITASQIKRYQDRYLVARGIGDDDSAASLLWGEAERVPTGSFSAVHDAYTAYQAENLRICRSLWASFDLVRIAMGIAVLFATFALLAMYAYGTDIDITPSLLTWGMSGLILGCLVGFLVAKILTQPVLPAVVSSASILGLVGSFLPMRSVSHIPFPRTFFSWTSTVATLLLCLSFGANSFTIWEDEILLYLLTTFGILLLLASLREPNPYTRKKSTLNALSFLITTRLASLSRLCREEQLPYCKSTFYASATSSTSAIWQLSIPILITLLLPKILKLYRSQTRSIPLRLGLTLITTYWLLDSADDGQWLDTLTPYLKSTRIILARGVLILLTLYAHREASLLLLLPLLVQKPMGQFALAMLLISLLNLAAITTPTPTALPALMGLFSVFKTGHQAVLASIQWEVAFTFSQGIVYPISPLAVGLNAFAGVVVTTVFVSRNRALAGYLLVHAAIAVATTMGCAWLRRHLMLYRVFMPRMLMAFAMVLVADLGAVIGLGMRWVREW